MNKEHNILSKFDTFKQNKAYNVPEGYFDSIAPRIQDRILIENETQQAKTPLLRSKPVFSYAIISICAVLLIFIGIKKLNNQAGNAQILNLRQDEIALILDNQVLSIDETTLANEIDIDNASSKSQSNTDFKYLIDNNIESSDILTEL